MRHVEEKKGEVDRSENKQTDQDSQTSEEKQVYEEDTQFRNPEESVVKKTLWSEQVEEADGGRKKPEIVKQKTTVKRQSTTQRVTNAAKIGIMAENKIKSDESDCDKCVSDSSDVVLSGVFFFFTGGPSPSRGVLQ